MSGEPTEGALRLMSHMLTEATTELARGNLRGLSVSYMTREGRVIHGYANPSHGLSSAISSAWLQCKQDALDEGEDIAEPAKA